MRPIFAFCLLSAVTAATPSALAQSKGAATPAQAQPKPAAPPAQAADAAKPSAADDDRKLFEEGTADLNAGRYAEAVEKLRAAWAKKKAYDIAGNLGTALVQLGKRAEAARLLSYAVTSFPAGGSPKEKAWVEETFADVRKEVVLVHVHMSVEGADVRLNGESLGRSPITEDAFVDAGAVLVEAKKEGFEDARVELEGDKGGTVDATVTMKAKGGAVPGPNRLPAYIAFGAGGVGLVLGAITGGVAAAAKADLAKTCKPSGACPESARGDLDRANALSYASTAGFAVAGIGAAVGVTLLLLSTKATSGTKAAVQVGPGFVGVKGVF